MIFPPRSKKGFRFGSIASMLALALSVLSRSPSQLSVLKSQFGSLNTMYLNKSTPGPNGWAPAIVPHPFSLPGERPATCDCFVRLLLTFAYICFAVSICGAVKQVLLSSALHSRTAGSNLHWRGFSITPSLTPSFASQAAIAAALMAANFGCGIGALATACPTQIVWRARPDQFTPGEPA